jgi:hypothetical protein
LTTEIYCSFCEYKFTIEDYSFGQNIQCPKCEKLNGTDWDYVGDGDSFAIWTTSEPFISKEEL